MSAVNHERARAQGEPGVVPDDDVIRCPICAEPFRAGDICGTDINEGACHAYPAALSAESEEVDCQNCAGNGEIVTNWDRYLHSHPGDVGDEAVAECPDCYGTGRVSSTPAPPPEPAKAEVVDGRPLCAADDPRIIPLQNAVEGECDGLAIDAEQCRAILGYIDTETIATPPAAPAAARSAAEEMREAAAKAAERLAKRARESSHDATAQGRKSRAQEWEQAYQELWTLADVIRALPPPSEEAWKPTHRHVKSGRLERVIGEAEAQVSTSPEASFTRIKRMDGKHERLISDGKLLTVYQNADGKMFVRFSDEFNDGRFVALPGEEA